MINNEAFVFVYIIQTVLIRKQISAVYLKYYQKLELEISLFRKLKVTLVATMIDGGIDFNGMSPCFGLFMPKD